MSGKIEDSRPWWSLPEAADRKWTEDDATCSHPDHVTIGKAYQKIYGSPMPTAKDARKWDAGDAFYYLYPSGVLAIASYPGNSEIRELRPSLAGIGEWNLVDASERHRENPHTFAVPADEELENLPPGCLVKVGVPGERFWVEVIEVWREGFHLAKLVNNLLTPEHVRGDRIVFERRHVMDVRRDLPEVLPVSTTLTDERSNRLQALAEKGPSCCQEHAANVHYKTSQCCCPEDGECALCSVHGAKNGTCCSCGYAGEEETPCPNRDDGQHCVHWWDGPDEEGEDAEDDGEESSEAPN